jgi:hypothetical protein
MAVVTEELDIWMALAAQVVIQGTAVMGEMGTAQMDQQVVEVVVVEEGVQNL